MKVLKYFQNTLVLKGLWPEYLKYRGFWKAVFFNYEEANHLVISTFDMGSLKYFMVTVQNHL